MSEALAHWISGPGRTFEFGIYYLEKRFGLTGRRRDSFGGMRIAAGGTNSLFRWECLSKPRNCHILRIANTLKTFTHCLGGEAV
jgi:hypothetical protein